MKFCSGNFKRKSHVAELGVDERMILTWRRGKGYKGVDRIELAQTGFCKYGNERLGPLKAGNSLTDLSNYQLSCRYRRVSSHLLGLRQLKRSQTIWSLLKRDTVLHI